MYLFIDKFILLLQNECKDISKRIFAANNKQSIIIMRTVNSGSPTKGYYSKSALYCFT